MGAWNGVVCFGGIVWPWTAKTLCSCRYEFTKCTAAYLEVVLWSECLGKGDRPCEFADSVALSQFMSDVAHCDDKPHNR